ncbi:hypothetical protein Fmac_026992 [Flemingia macrophylla]|uniref:PGG domain-containing protein n=1 Tax=Flemingia macrophylla TaxID=520843 RepID=A0ABD1LGN9_9FABA
MRTNFLQSFPFHVTIIVLLRIKSSFQPWKMNQQDSTTIEGVEVDTDQFSVFRGCVLEGRWDYVIPAYKNNSDFHKIKINESRGTALHVAVNDGMVGLVDILVGVILEHEGREVLRDDSALRSTNERGDTPLHLAASRGFIRMCMSIIGESGERKDLIKDLNNKGESPLFRTVLTGQTKTFVYLYHASVGLNVPFTNNDGDTILHAAIWGEFLDLALMITHCYSELVSTRDKHGATPLKVLADKPKAFTSGSSLSWWKQTLYYCIPVKQLNIGKTFKSYIQEVENFHEQEVINIDKEGIFFPQKYQARSVKFVKSVVRLAFKGLSISGLGVTAEAFKALWKIKQKHTWGGQLLNIFMKQPYESYMGLGVDQLFMRHDLPHQHLEMVATRSLKSQENPRMESAERKEEKETTFVALAKAGIVELVNELQNKVPKALHDTTTPDKESLLVVAMKHINLHKLREHDVDKKETAFLAAARNGIKEIVFVVQSKITSAVHETNSNKENVLLVAVKNRQINVVEMLRKHLDKELFDSLIFEVDNKENTVLHLAALSTNSERNWQLAGIATQIMSNIKWYEYISSLLPEHFTLRRNKHGETAIEIFEDNHKYLMKKSLEWLKETSSSCSAVATLVAGVSFAASSTVPGGTEKGKPSLEGQPAFDAFAIASLMALCFSVTALMMFLSIYTSEKRLEDFRKSLPLKLLVGLTSLFLSIVSMIVTFFTAHFFVVSDKLKNKLFPLYIATSFPVIFYAIMQFQLYFNLLKAIFSKLPQPSVTQQSLFARGAY